MGTWLPTTCLTYSIRKVLEYKSKVNSWVIVGVYLRLYYFVEIPIPFIVTV